MAKVNAGAGHKSVVKTTCQNGSKTSTLNKTRKGSKAYRGQGR